MTDLNYVNVDGKKLKQGYTTGACAAGAAKAAATLFVKRILPEKVNIPLPSGGNLCLPVSEGAAVAGGARACVVKDGGDDPDNTHGLCIWTEVIPEPLNREISFQAGPGVGTVTKPGLQVPVGEPAINPVPRRMITQALREILPPGWGAKVTVFVPGGEQAARKTLNPKLGVIGGISILGTTGIVQPMSEEAYKSSLIPQLVQSQTFGHKAIVLVPGRIGAKRAVESFGVPPEAVAEMSNFVGFMLMECAARGIKEVILMGHISKLIKVAAGNFHTHNRVADARLETLTAYCAIEGMAGDDLKKLMQCVTVEGALKEVERAGLQVVYRRLAEVAAKRATEHTYGEVKVGVVLLDMDGRILGIEDHAKSIAAQQVWRIE